MSLLSSAKQLGCAGVVSAMTVSGVAFPNRLMHSTAIVRFRCLSLHDALHNVDEKKDEASDESGLQLVVNKLFFRIY